jgi:glycine oxidase
VKSSVSDSSSGQKIAILGGGLAGRLLAWRLASRHNDQGSIIDNGINPDTEIHVFEKGALRPDLHGSDKAAAFTAAAMISPLSELVASELEIYQLGQASLALWPIWLGQLDCLQHFHQHGSLVLAHPNDLAELRQFQRDLDFKLQQLPNEYSHPHPHPHPHSHSHSLYQDLQGQDQVAVFEPQIAAHFKQGLFLQDEAHIDHHEVLAQLVQQALALGVQYYQNQALEVNDPALAEFDLIFDCRGMGGKNTDKTLRGVRGEVIWLECKEITLSRPIRLMHPRYKLYVVPKPNHQFIIGATEIESEDRSPISLRSSMELMSALYAINPAFAEARIIAQDCNLRPAYIDNLPQIEQRISALDQPIISINGLYRHGYLIGPAIIEQAIGKAFL